jgi:hypothetical protein
MSKGTKTISEDLFEQWCHSVGVPCHRVEEEQDARRPDYVVELIGQRVVTEVKQFDPNDEEAESNRRVATGGIGGTGTTPGDRIRKAIHRAAPQLKALSSGKYPALLVVYNNGASRLHTDPYAVATAMQGLDEVPVLVPEDPLISPKFKEARSGRGKKMTPSANTTISAIGVLVHDFDDRTHLCIYHNCHALHPIVPEWLRHPLVHHYRLPDSAASSLDGWQAV